MTTTAARTPETTDRATTTAPAPTADTRRRRVSARVRILLWLLLVMALALAAVAMTTRSFLLRDVDHRIDRLLTQETGLEPGREALRPAAGHRDRPVVQ